MTAIDRDVNDTDAVAPRKRTRRGKMANVLLHLVESAQETFAATTSAATTDP
jgi:hypothetical protein